MIALLKNTKTIVSIVFLLVSMGGLGYIKILKNSNHKKAVQIAQYEADIEGYKQSFKEMEKLSKKRQDSLEKLNQLNRKHLGENKQLRDKLAELQRLNDDVKKFLNTDIPGPILDLLRGNKKESSAKDSKK